MQFKIDIQSNHAGWQVQIFDPMTGAPILQPRQLRRLGNELQAVPLPPEDELVARPAGLPPHYQLCQDLCTTTNEMEVIDIYTKIINRAPGQKDMQRFGSYLFVTLLGKSWNRIHEIACNQPIELALTWNDDQVINRLPWEMMHGPDGFLAEIPVAITRRVAGAMHVPNLITSEPRILFVIGTDLGKDVIRPGAEYLGLLRTLQQAGLVLKTHLLLRANIEKLKAAIKWFQPTIVHFICHGVFDGKTSYLELMSDQINSDKPFPARSTNLLQALRPEPDIPLPTIVLLSACSTANTEPVPQEAGQIASPLAVELVQGGIPIVVGMAGEVSDQACRLFSRRFFEALLQNWDIPYAVAEGRRGGIISNGSDPKTSVDWALPTLFLSAGMKNASLRVELPQPIRNLHAIAEEYSSTAYPDFCDRLELLQWYDILMADTAAQKQILLRSADVQVLAISVQTTSGSRNQYGRTRLLKELASHSVINGHIPCILIDDDISRDWPRTLPDLLKAIMISMNIVTAQRFEVKPPPRWKYLPLLKQQQKGEALPDWAPKELQEIYNNVEQDPTHLIVIATAFRLDLLRFLDIINSTFPEQERDKTKLLLLIDDLHRMDKAASELLYLYKYGLRPASAKIRMVFTYSRVAGAGEGPAVSDIEKWLSEAKWAESVPLVGFRYPQEARLAYQQFLLSWREGNGSGPRMPLTLAVGAKAGDIKQFFRRLHEATQQGIPAYLESPEVLREIQGYLNYSKEELEYELLCKANDDDVLRNLLNYTHFQTGERRSST